MTISKSRSRCQTPVRNLQHPPKHQNQDLKDIDDLWTFKVKIGRQYLDYRFINDKWPYPNQGQNPKPQSGTSNILKSTKLRVKGQGCSWKIGSQNLEHGCNNDQQLYLNQDQNPKSQSGTSSILRSPNSELKEYGCSWHLENQNREPKFGT